ncbi:hypothetical protein RDI58_009603 [Solanum bulbocastanum]|uniref:Uncharacterized protein n=1 Tax=Solanum bulbocastanum TaxID=147425 RepID=A0AAN8TSF5_SOLBU
MNRRRSCYNCFSGSCCRLSTTSLCTHFTS